MKDNVPSTAVIDIRILFKFLNDVKGMLKFTPQYDFILKGINVSPNILNI